VNFPNILVAKVFQVPVRRPPSPGTGRVLAVEKRWVKARRGVFFQAVLSSNPGQVKKLSFKDNCLDSEIFVAYQCWD